MTVATRESTDWAKAAAWLVIVQGVPYAWTNGGWWSTLPLSANQFAPYNNLRPGVSTNIREGDVPVLQTLVEVPAISAQSLDWRANMGASAGRAAYRMGQLTVRAVLDSLSQALFAMQQPPFSRLGTAVAAGTTEYLDLSLNGDVTAIIDGGDYIYMGLETLRVDANNPPSYDSGTGKTTVRAFRGQCGSGRPAHPVGQKLYLAPPSWASRRVALLRTFKGETDFATWFVGSVDSWQPDRMGVEWVMLAVDLTAGLGADVNLPLWRFGDDPPPKAVGVFSTGTRDVSDIGITGRARTKPTETYRTDGDDTSNVPAELRYLQIGKEIVKGRVFTSNFEKTQTTPQPDTDAQLIVTAWKQDRGRWGTPVTAPYSIDGVDVSYNDATGVFEESKKIILRGGSLTDFSARDDDAYQLLHVTGHPALAALRLLQSGGGGGTYDELRYGAALGNELVDVAAFEAVADETYDVAEMSFVLGWGGKSFNPVTIARRLLSWLGYAVVPNAQGKLAPFEWAVAINPVVTPNAVLGTDDILRDSRGELRLVTAAFPIDETISSVRFLIRGDFREHFKGGDDNVWTIADEDLVAIHGEKLATIDAAITAGNRTGLNDNLARWLSIVAFKMLRRYGRTPTIVTATLPLDYGLFGLGSVLQLDLTLVGGLFNAVTGSLRPRTGDWFIAVESREINLAEGWVQVTGPLFNGRATLISPTALVTGYAAGVVTCAANEFVVSGSGNPAGAVDAAHFPVGSIVKFYNAAGPSWRANSGDIGTGTVTAQSGNTVTITLDAALTANPPQAGDIMGIADWPDVRNLEPQKWYAHWADDGARANANDGDEYLPVSFDPSVFTDDPFVLE
jgi:hypothetical protein